MNPFARQNPLPPGTIGERHFPSAAAAKESAVNHGVASYAILQAGQEYAWISPLDALSARSMQLLGSGIQIVEIDRK